MRELKNPNKVIMVHGDVVSLPWLHRYLAFKAHDMDVVARHVADMPTGKRAELIIVDDIEEMVSQATNEFIIQRLKEYESVDMPIVHNGRAPQTKGDRKRNRRFRWC